MADRAHGAMVRLAVPSWGCAAAQRDTHILADIGLALHAVLEEQVETPVAAFFSSRPLGSAWDRRYIPRPLRSCCTWAWGTHGHVGVDLQGQGFLVLFSVSWTFWVVPGAAGSQPRSVAA